MRHKIVAVAIVVAICTVYSDSSIIKGDTLPCVELEGFRNARHAQWCVGSGEGNALTVVFYSVPRDRKIVENAADCITDKKVHRAGLTLYYVVNKKDVKIPATILSTMLRNRSRKYPDITYCIDSEERLPAVWKFDPRQAHVIVVDKSGVVMFSGGLPLKQDECKALNDSMVGVP